MANSANHTRDERVKRIHDQLDELVPEDALESFGDKLAELSERVPGADALLQRIAPVEKPTKR